MCHTQSPSIIWCRELPGALILWRPNTGMSDYGAAFWFQEHVKSASAITRRKIVYNLCYKGGKIDLKTYKKPPEPLCTLLCFDGDARSKQFLRQI
jgi:hypothetical protein